MIKNMALALSTLCPLFSFAQTALSEGEQISLIDSPTGEIYQLSYNEAATILKSSHGLTLSDGEQIFIQAHQESNTVDISTLDSIGTTVGIELLRDLPRNFTIGE